MSLLLNVLEVLCDAPGAVSLGDLMGKVSGKGSLSGVLRSLAASEWIQVSLSDMTCSATPLGKLGRRCVQLEAQYAELEVRVRNLNYAPESGASELPSTEHEIQPEDLARALADQFGEEFSQEELEECLAESSGLPRDDRGVDVSAIYEMENEDRGIQIEGVPGRASVLPYEKRWLRQLVISTGGVSVSVEFGASGTQSPIIFTRTDD